MKHVALLLIGSVLLMGCGSDELVQPPLGPPAPPPPTFVVFGIVEKEDGSPLRDATAELFRIGQITQAAITNDSGFFSFSGVRGPATVRVSKPGYVSTMRFLDVTDAVLTRLTLVRLLPDAVLTLGETIKTTVQAGAPPCDPAGWDASAPCRKFLFIAPATGKLVVLISWNGDPELDAVLVAIDGGYVASSDTAEFESFRLEAPVVKGTEYELRVNAYYGTQEFELKADLIP